MPSPTTSTTHSDRTLQAEGIEDAQCGRRPQRLDVAYLQSYLAVVRTFPQTESGYVDWAKAPEAPTTHFAFGYLDSPEQPMMPED